MKVFMTNQYGYIKDETIFHVQSEFAKIGHELGLYEMGVFVYDVSSDNDMELAKRLDGIIASVEKDDVVIVQLPTGNGTRFEEKLFNKITVYSGRKPLVLWHSAKYYHENHDKYFEYIYDEVEPTLNDSYDVLGLEKKKILIDLISQNIKSDDSACKETEDMIHIGFGLHDKTGNYSVWVGTAMQSIIENTDAKIKFHILHDHTLSDINRKRLKTVAERVGDEIQFHSFDPLIFGALNDTIGRYTIGTMFRTMLPEILPDIERIIYLDADLFVNRDIKELWDVSISEFCLAAVPDHPTVRNCGTPYPVWNNQVERKKYFNAGVLYMNLANMRKAGNTCELVLKYLQDNPEAFLFDQDALNVVYADDIFLLDESWNYFIDEIRKGKQEKSEKKVYHYAGTKLVLYFKNEVDIAYYETILRTPWGKTEGHIQLTRSLGKMIDRTEQLQLLIEKITRRDRKVIFYGNSISMQSVMKMLNVEKENCLYFEELDEDTINQYREDTFIVSAEADHNKGLEKLEKNGLINGKDFIVTQRLVEPFEGGFLY